VGLDKDKQNYFTRVDQAGSQNLEVILPCFNTSLMCAFEPNLKRYSLINRGFRELKGDFFCSSPKFFDSIFRANVVVKKVND